LEKRLNSFFQFLILNHHILSLSQLVSKGWRTISGVEILIFVLLVISGEGPQVDPFMKQRFLHWTQRKQAAVGFEYLMISIKIR
jgi:hypothetical protein